MPFRSASQLRLIAAKERRGELPRGTFQEWLRATPSVKALPERVSEKHAMWAACADEFLKIASVASGTFRAMWKESPEAARRFITHVYAGKAAAPVVETSERAALRAARELGRKNPLVPVGMEPMEARARRYIALQGGPLTNQRLIDMVTKITDARTGTHLVIPKVTWLSRLKHQLGMGGQKIREVPFRPGVVAGADKKVAAGLASGKNYKMVTPMIDAAMATVPTGTLRRAGPILADILKAPPQQFEIMHPTVLKGQLRGMILEALRQGKQGELRGMQKLLTGKGK